MDGPEARRKRLLRRALGVLCPDRKSGPILDGFHARRAVFHVRKHAETAGERCCMEQQGTKVKAEKSATRVLLHSDSPRPAPLEPSDLREALNSHTLLADLSGYYTNTNSAGEL